MTNCNDCIHEQTCDQSSRQLWSIMAGELECTDFKDRNKYVEVVRCKACKYWEQGKGYEPYCNHWGNMMSDTEADDYCSYGERRKYEL